MSESIFEQHEILDKLYQELKHIEQVGDQPTYERLLKIASHLTHEEYEVIMERYQGYVKEQAHKILPDLAEQLSLVHQELFSRIEGIVADRELKILDKADKALKEEVARLNSIHEQELQELLAKQEELKQAITEQNATIDSLKADNLAKQQRIESMLYDVETLAFLRRISAIGGKDALERLPFHPQLNSSLREINALVKSFSKDQLNAWSLLVSQAFNLVKGAQALGFSINDLSTQEPKSNELTEQQQALAALKAKFKHIEQLGADNSYFMENESFESQDEDASSLVSKDHEIETTDDIKAAFFEQLAKFKDQEQHFDDLLSNKLLKAEPIEASTLAKSVTKNDFDDVEIINSSLSKAIPRDEGTLVRDMINGDNVAAFAAASAKIASLAPMLHDTERNQSDDLVSDDENPSAKVEIASVAHDVVKVASELERSGEEKVVKKVSLFDTSGDNEQLGTTVFGAELNKSEISNNLEEDSVEDFITGNIQDCDSSEGSSLELTKAPEHKVCYQSSTTTTASGKTNIITNTPIDKNHNVAPKSLGAKDLDGSFNKNTAIIVNNSSSLKDAKDLELKGEGVSLMAKDLMVAKPKHTKVIVGTAKVQDEFAHLKNYQSLDDDGKRRFALLSNMIDESLKERAYKLNTLIDTKVKTQDMVLFYQSYINSLGSQGMLTQELKSALLEKMEYDLKEPHSSTIVSYTKNLEATASAQHVENSIKAKEEDKEQIQDKANITSSDVEQVINTTKDSEELKVEVEPKSPAQEQATTSADVEQVIITTTKDSEELKVEVEPKSPAQEQVTTSADVEQVISTTKDSEELKVEVEPKSPAQEQVTTSADVEQIITTTKDSEELKVEVEPKSQVQEQATNKYKTEAGAGAFSEAVPDATAEIVDKPQAKSSKRDNTPVLTDEEIEALLGDSDFEEYGGEDFSSGIFDGSGSDISEETYKNILEQLHAQGSTADDANSFNNSLLVEGSGERPSFTLTPEEQEALRSLSLPRPEPIAIYALPNWTECSNPTIDWDEFERNKNKPHEFQDLIQPGVTKSVATDAQDLLNRYHGTHKDMFFMDNSDEDDVPDAQKDFMSAIIEDYINNKDKRSSAFRIVEDEGNDDDDDTPIPQKRQVTFSTLVEDDDSEEVEPEDDDLIITPANEYKGLNKEESFTVDGATSSYQSPDFRGSDNSSFGKSLSSSYKHPQEATFMFQELKGDTPDDKH